MKLSVKDYQIVKKADLDFKKGLNVIVGPSNNGKSSLIKACKTAIFNELGTSSIRVGANSFMVGIQYNGHTVIFQKGLKESAYSIDGERYSKLGRGQVPQVAEALGIKELIINGNKETINFWDQMQYPFLLDRSSVDLYRFIVDSGEDDNLMKCLKDMVSDRQSLNKECNVIEGQIDQIAQQVVDLDTQLENSDEELKVIQSIIELKDKVSRLETLKNIKNSIMSEETKLVDVNQKLEKIKKEAQIYKDCSSYLIDQNLKEKSLKVHKEVLDKLKTQLNDVDRQLKKLSIYQIIDSKENLEHLSVYINILQTMKYLRDSINNINLKEVPSVSYTYKDIQKLETLYSQSKKLKDLMLQKDYNEKALEKSTENINIIKEVQSYIKVCPLCGQSLI